MMKKAIVKIRKQRYQSFMNDTAYYYTDSAKIEFIFTRGQTRNYPWHVHTRHWTAGVVRSGIVTLTTDAGVRRLRGGQRFFIRPYEPHSLSLSPECSLLVLCVDSVGVLSTEHGALHEFLRHIPLFQDQVQPLAQSFALACAENPFSDMPARRHSREASDALISRSVQAVMLLIKDDPNKFSSIEQMADHAGYSPWHFLRAFQKATGITPHAFKLLCRLRLLRDLLRSGTASATAAVSAGFSDQSHMHKVFKRHHGMTPKQFTQASFRLEL